MEVDSPGATSITDVETDTIDPEYNRISVTLTSGVNISDRDFLNRNTNLSSISGQVLDDTENDGIINPVNDLGIGGVSVQLYVDSNNDGVVDIGDTLIDDTITDADGSYQFNNLSDGNYVIQQVNPTGTSSENDTQGNSLDGNIGVTLSGANSSNNNLLDDGAIVGTTVSNTLNGTSNDEFIIGGKGQDTISGNGGNDTFYFNETSEGIDLITDFNPNGDLLDFRGIVTNELGEVSNPWTNGYIEAKSFGSSTMIQVDYDPSDSSNDVLTNKNVVLLSGIDSSNIDASDFLF